GEPHRRRGSPFREPAGRSAPALRRGPREVTPKAPPLPTGVLICTLGALVLGTCSGMGATSQMLTLVDPASAVVRSTQETQTDAELAVDRALTELQIARERAGRPFRSLRLVTVLLLSLSTMFCLV